MPTFTIKARLTTLADPHIKVREITTNIAGCRDEEHAREKFPTLYHGDAKILWVKPFLPTHKRG